MTFITLEYKLWVTYSDVFLRSLGHGTLALFQNLSEGTFTSLSSLSGSLARNLEKLHAEDNYSRKRENLRASTPRNIGSGVSVGVQSLTNGVAGGLTGVVTAPSRGLQEEGAWGLMKGVGYGLLGVVTKPVSGVLDLVSTTSQGIAQTTSQASPAKRRPLPLKKQYLLKIIIFLK